MDSKKCRKEVGSFIHTIRTCVHFHDFWVKVVSKLNLVFNKELDLDPVCLLLGIPHAQTTLVMKKKYLTA